jgi:hypothetical protein
MTRLFIVIALLAVIFSGCSASQKTAAYALLECRTAVLEPYLGEQTADVIRAALTHSPNAIAIALYNLGVTPAEILELAAKWRACSPPKLPSPKPAPPLMTADAGASL